MSAPLNLLWPRLLQLLDCLCTSIEDCGLDPVCVCQPMPGMDVALDYTDGACEQDGADGMAWIRLVSVWNTDAFPQVMQTPSRCDNYEAAFSFEVGIVRSVPIDSEGNPPSPDVLLALTERQVSEALLMQRAITCCFDEAVLLGTYAPIGPQGAAVGGRWVASALVDP